MNVLPHLNNWKSRPSDTTVKLLHHALVKVPVVRVPYLLPSSEPWSPQHEWPWWHSPLTHCTWPPLPMSSSCVAELCQLGRKSAPTWSSPLHTHTDWHMHTNTDRGPIHTHMQKHAEKTYIHTDTHSQTHIQVFIRLQGAENRTLQLVQPLNTTLLHEFYLATAEMLEYTSTQWPNAYPHRLVR